MPRLGMNYHSSPFVNFCAIGLIACVGAMFFREWLDNLGFFPAGTGNLFDWFYWLIRAALQI